jgi:hypothetical protein
MDEHKRICADDERASRLAPKRRYDRFDFGVTMNGRYDLRHFERPGRLLEYGR